jgi:hypothetical protein
MRVRVELHADWCPDADNLAYPPRFARLVLQHL